MAAITKDGDGSLCLAIRAVAVVTPVSALLADRFGSRVAGGRCPGGYLGFSYGLHREHTQLYATRLKATDFETGVVAFSFVWQ